MLMIEPVWTRRDKRVFINLPWKLYRGDPNWVPPLKIDMHDTLNPRKNALLRLGPYQYFLAYRYGKPVGRIGVGIDEHLNEVKNFKGGYLTLFESINDYEVAEALFDTGSGWLRNKGMDFVTGPQSPSNGDDYRGLLYKGFDSPPVLYSSYNPTYYVEFFDRYGFRKDFDRNAYHLELSGGMPARMERAVAYAMKRYRFHTRRMNLKNVQEELTGINDVLQAGWPQEWPDMVPPTMEEIQAEYKKLLPFADRDLLWVAETDEGRIIGFMVALPDYNQCFARMNGRLLPFGVFKFVWHRRKLRSGRSFIMFVHPDYQQKGAAAAIYLSIYNAARAKGYTHGEGSSIHEFNVKMNRDAVSAGGKLYKIYRVYRKELAQPQQDTPAMRA